MVSPGVDLYNTAYGNYERDLYREVRLETYGEDFGQTSWVTTEESHEIPRLVGLTSACSVLEVGCGSGGYALHLAETYRCNIVGLDLNAEGIRNANALAEQKKLGALCRFQECDARRKRKAEFMAVEGEANFKGLQRFLDCVHKLCSERRLLRFLYVARK